MDEYVQEVVERRRDPYSLVEEMIQRASDREGIGSRD